jgi:OPA family glycerol-3-phosphate transporter-like MFS transporter
MSLVKDTREALRLQRWGRLVVLLMVAGYAGYYLCRSNLSATMPLITEELVARGMGPAAVKDALGWAVSLGTIAYALGKFAAGSLADLLGGRRSFLIGMAGAVACTILLPLGSSVVFFTLVWICNRLIQSLGWPGMIKITSRWFAHSSYNRVAGVISLSFLFGDAAARAFMGWLIEAGLGWRGVFCVAASVLAALLVVNVLFLRESPVELNLPEPATNPENLFGVLGEDPHPEAAGPVLATLARSPAFWIVCLLSLGLTLLRESFNNWTPTYLVESVGLGKGAAAGMSGVFPFFGGISVILAGFLGDRFGRIGRAAIILGSILLCGLSLGVLASSSFAGRSHQALALVAVVAFLLVGPYSYLAGAISLDFGGKRGAATASGIIDGVGYLLGGVIAGKVVAGLSHTLGWQGVFLLLAGVSLGTGVVAAFYLVNQRQTGKMDRVSPLERE